MEDTRVTVKLDQDGLQDSSKFYSGKVVSPMEPFKEAGRYWGYTVRVANTISEVFEGCPYVNAETGEPEGYDLKIGDCCNGGKDDAEVMNVKRIDEINFEKYRGFKHALVFVGGLEGISGVIESLEAEEKILAKDTANLFDECLINCPEQGSRTIRTEECILMSLSQLMPHLRAHGSNKEATHMKLDKDGHAKSVLL